MRTYWFVFALAGCTAANTHRQVDGGGVNGASGDGGGVNGTSGGMNGTNGGGDGGGNGSNGGDGGGNNGTNGGMNGTNGGGDGGADMSTPADLAFGGGPDLRVCTTPVAASAAFVHTDFAGGAITITVPDGRHLTGSLALANDLPPGTALTDGNFSFVVATDANNKSYIAQVTVPAGSSKAFDYDVVVPAGTYSLSWVYTLQYAGGIFLTRRGVVTGVDVGACDTTRDIVVPAFGDMKSATVSLGGLSALPTLTNAELDVVVDFTTADRSFQVEASSQGVTGDSVDIPIFMPSFSTIPLVQLSGSSDFSPVYQTVMSLTTVAGGHTSYPLLLPQIANLEGDVSDPGNHLEQSFPTSALFCDSTTGDAARGFFGSGTTHYHAPYQRFRACTPYFVYAMSVASTFNGNENSDVALFAPNPSTVTPVTISNPSPSPFPAPSPLPVPSLGTLTTVFGQLNDARGAPIAGYSVRALSSSLTNPALAGDQVGVSPTFDPAAVTVTTDNNGQFKLHLPSGTYDVTVRQ